MSKLLIKRIVAFTSDDNAFIKKRSAALGLTISGYIRLLVMKDKNELKKEAG